MSPIARNGWHIANKFTPKSGSRPFRRSTRTRNGNPLIAPYTAQDGRFFWLLGFESDRHWPGVLKAIGHEEWASDDRFSSAASRSKNSADLVAQFDALFQTKPLEEWARIFDEHKVWWQPVQTVDDIIVDEQAQPAFVPIPAGTQEAEEGNGVQTITSIKGPIDFGELSSDPSGPVPALGEHTAQVLREAGFSAEEIAAIEAQAQAKKATAGAKARL